jgi:hypothetical protein
MESPAQTASELQDVLRWKMERGFGAPLEDLSVSKERLGKMFKVEIVISHFDP